MKAIVIGIMPQDKIRERVLSIARGEHKPKSGEPKIWFTSMRSLAEVLSDENRALLQVIVGGNLLPTATDTHLSRHPLIESCQFLPTVVLCRL
jgi:hypothetical protein